MAISVNGIAEAAKNGVKSGWARASKESATWGRKMAVRGMSRGKTFMAMAKNEGYWKAYQKALQGPMIDGAVKGAMIGAGLNTAQYLYANSDRPDLGGAAGAAFRGAVGGAAAGGVYGAGQAAFGSRASLRTGRLAAKAKAAAPAARAARPSFMQALRETKLGGSGRGKMRWGPKPMGPHMSELMAGPQMSELMYGPLAREAGVLPMGVRPGSTSQRPAFLGGSHKPSYPSLSTLINRNRPNAPAAAPKPSPSLASLLNRRGGYF